MSIVYGGGRLTADYRFICGSHGSENSLYVKDGLLWPDDNKEDRLTGL